LKELPAFSNDGITFSDAEKVAMQARLKAPMESDAFLAEDFRFRKTTYPHWGPDTGDFSFITLIPKPEIRRARIGENEVVVAINHSADLNTPPDTVTLSEDPSAEVYEITAQGRNKLESAEVRIAPQELRMFEIVSPAE